ncbi:MAG: hypothetical protein ACK5Q5_14660 [Planctomycetaceae bacterium]
MTFAAAEDLKESLTDKYVVVQEGVAELRRFAGLTGQVKTVNMSGRALIQFDGPVDIGWYDIDPAYLTVVDKPLPKPPAGHEKPAAKPAAAKPTVAAKGGSPLDMIRKQGAAKPAGGSAPAAPAAAGAKPSPLDLIRKQGAAKPAEEAAEQLAEASAPPAAAPAPSAPAKPPAGMSPLDMIRKQGAAKR